MRTCVRTCVRHELISETAPRIFAKLGMKLGDNKGKKIAEPFFEKNSHFARENSLLGLNLSKYVKKHEITY